MLQRAASDRPRVNPLFGDNRLKLGTFGTNGKGAAQTLLPEAYRPSWAASLQTARMADAAGYEAILAYARWKGYMVGKPAHPSGVVLDPFTWCAGLAQATSYSALLATAHAPTIHPVTAAKQTATIDIIADGRFALNVVGGWNKPEMEMFGAPLREHDERYDHLQEWVEVVQRLWAEEEEFDHDGRFFQVKGGCSMPKPVQRPGPPIISAGMSGRGKRFSCGFADICFTVLPSDSIDERARQIAGYKDYALQEFGRHVQVWTFGYCVQRETRRDAADYLELYSVTHADNASLDAWSDAVSDDRPPEQVLQMRQRFAAGGGGVGLVGTAEDIAGQLQELSDAGLDGVLLTWVDFVSGMADFNRQVLPLLEQRGLRRPFNPPSAII
jgi:FMNH2-dependent dimethyl sulfone monooxygenase